MLRERSERRKIEEKKRFGHKTIISPRPLGGGGARRVRPPPLDPLVPQILNVNLTVFLNIYKSRINPLIVVRKYKNVFWSQGTDMFNYKQL